MNTEQTGTEFLTWFKSSYSSGSGGECIEVAPTPAAVHVRDSKDTGCGIVAVGPAAWSAFLDLARHG